MLLSSLSISSGRRTDYKGPSIINITDNFYKNKDVRIQNAFLASINQSYLTQKFEIRVYFPHSTDTVLLISNSTAVEEDIIDRTHCSPLKMGSFIQSRSDGDAWFAESLEHNFKNKKSEIKLTVIKLQPSTKFIMFYFQKNANCTRTKSVVDIIGITAYTKVDECYNTDHKLEISNIKNTDTIKCIDDYKDASIKRRLALVDVEVTKVINTCQYVLKVLISFVVLISSVGIIIMMVVLCKKKKLCPAEQASNSSESRELVPMINCDNNVQQTSNRQVLEQPTPIVICNKCVQHTSDTLEQDVPYPKGYLISGFQKYGTIKEVYSQDFNKIEWAIIDEDLPEQWPKNLTKSYHFESAPYTYRSGQNVENGRTMPQKDIIFILKLELSNKGIKVSAFLPNNNRCNKRLPIPFNIKLCLKIPTNNSDNGENAEERIENIGFQFHSLCEDCDFDVPIIDIDTGKIKFKDLSLKLFCK